MHKRRDREIKHTGDGSLATFDEPSRAIEAPGVRCRSTAKATLAASVSRAPIVGEAAARPSFLRLTARLLSSPATTRTDESSDDMRVAPAGT